MVGTGDGGPKERRKKALSGEQKRFIGVRQRPSGRWVAEIKDSLQKVRLWLGTFDTAEDAARAYDDAARNLRGANARTNFDSATSSGAGAGDARGGDPLENMPPFSFEDHGGEAVAAEGLAGALQAKLLDGKLAKALSARLLRAGNEDAGVPNAASFQQLAAAAGKHHGCWPTSSAAQKAGGLAARPLTRLEEHLLLSPSTLDGPRSTSSSSSGVFSTSTSTSTGSSAAQGGATGGVLRFLDPCVEAAASAAAAQPGARAFPVPQGVGSSYTNSFLTSEEDQACAQGPWDLHPQLYSF